MKKFLKALLGVSLAFLLVSTSAKAVSTLLVQQGGTGVGTITGIVKGNGTSAFTTATPGTDYPGFASNNIFTGQNTFTNANQTNIANLNTILYADQYSGSDIGAQVNAAYAACPSTGCKIMIPAGVLTQSTDIAITTSLKPALLQCAPGGATTINYTGSGSAVTFNVTSQILTGYGIDGCKFVGTGSTNTGTGLVLGGTTGAAGVTIVNTQFRGFLLGVSILNNAYLVNLTNDVFNFNGKDLFESGTSNTGENMTVIHTTFADSNNQTDGTSVANYCVDIQTSGETDWNITDSSFDDCQLYVDMFGGTGNSVHIFGGHFENPARNGIAAYNFIKMQGNRPAVDVGINGTVFLNDATTSSPGAFILNGSDLSLVGVAAQKLSSASTVTAMVQNIDATNVDTVTWSGFYNKGSAVTNMYGSVPPGPMGSGDGTGTPFYVQKTGTNLGGVGIGNVTAPTARLEIGGGTQSAGTAPLKIDSGTLLTTTEAGAVENDGNHLYFTPTASGTRYQLDQQTGAISSVSNSDSSLTISPTTGAVVASINLGHTNTWTAGQTFNGGVTSSSFNGSGSAASISVQTNTSATNADFVSGGTGSPTSTGSFVQFAGSTTVNYRALMNGNSSTTAGSGNPYSAFIVGSMPITVPSTGPTPWLVNTVINPLGTVTNATPITITNTATLYVGAASTAGTNNYALYVNGSVANAASQTTITPTGGSAAGNIVCSEPENGPSYKRVICYFSGYTFGTNGEVYTYPIAFSHTPIVSASGVTVTASASTTAYTITAGAGQTGFVILEGY